MNRRKFIAATSVSVGVAGCLTGNGTDDGNDGADSDDAGDASLDANDSADASHSSDPGADGNRNDSDNESATDSESNDSDGSDADEGNDTNETDGENEDESVPSERTTSFESCTRATVSGSFADGDVAFASTGFYDDDGLYGNTIVEDGVVFGDDVAAPFSGTVVFEVGAQAGVSEGSDEIVVTVSDYGSVGTVITSLTTEQTDYAVGSPTTPNPHAEDCLSELESEAGGDGSDGGSDDDGGDDGSGDTDNESDDGESGNSDNESNNTDSDGGDGESDAGAEPSLEVSIVGTNSPVDAGDSLEGTVRVENTGGAAGTGSVDLIVGRDPTPVESRSVSLEAGAQTTLTMGYQTPPVASDQQFPVRVETADDSDQQTVRVRGTQ
ncbi:hypothetical protein [Haloterrigena salinisoli]|uniref:hypothetical protein n=1 Tax=Haloterrigena salinisoli TaxID=3132747 RepID=UPI0030D62A0C